MQFCKLHTIHRGKPCRHACKNYVWDETNQCINKIEVGNKKTAVVYINVSGSLLYKHGNAFKCSTSLDLLQNNILPQMHT